MKCNYIQTETYHYICEFIELNTDTLTPLPYNCNRPQRTLLPVEPVARSENFEHRKDVKPQLLSYSADLGCSLIRMRLRLLCLDDWFAGLPICRHNSPKIP